jgi:hypothetical protein
MDPSAEGESGMTDRSRRKRRGRSTRSYIVELVFVVIIITAIYLWMTNGGQGSRRRRASRML